MASRKRSRSVQQTRILGAAIGLIIILTFMISLIAPDLGRRRNSGSGANPNVILDTPTPLLVAPPPDPDPQLEGKPPYIHSSGYFYVFYPAGDDWTVSESTAGDADVTSLNRVFLRSSTKLVVIHNYIQPGVEYETLASLSTNLLTREHFASAWVDYDTWLETNRVVTDDYVITDFALSARGIDYLARTTNWLVDDILYAARIVVPNNNPDLLNLLQGYVVEGFVGLPEFQAMDETWPVFADQELGYAIKYPLSWQQVAGDIGRPVTFRAPTAEGESTIRCLTTPDYPLEAMEDAEAWLLEEEPTAEVLTTQEVVRGVGTGYQIAYAYTNAAGDVGSGLVVLLNDAAGTLFSANMQLDTPDLNLLEADDLPALEQDTRQAVQMGFIVLPEEARIAAAPAEAE